MNVLIFGASGMVGQGVLRETIAATDVDHIFIIGRRQLEESNERVTQLICEDFTYLSQTIEQLPKIDACFFCLGQTSIGMDEQQYHVLTYDLTLSAAKSLQEKNSKMTFIYVSAIGADSSEQGKTMWARVRGATENALLDCGLSMVYIFRPGIIQPLNGIRSKTTSYRVIYQLMAPLLPLLKRLFPNHILTTVDMGQAMLKAVTHGYTTSILEVKDIAILARR